MKTSRYLISVVLMTSFQLISQDRKAQRMEEASINIGYGYIRKRSLTSSVSQVSVRQEDVGSYANIGEYLRGRVPGLVVQKDASASIYGTRGACGVILITTRRSGD